MDRRTFLRGTIVLPGIMTVAQAASASQYGRISCEKDDPGYRAYWSLMADGYEVHVFLDGVEQKKCVTADAHEGWVKRLVTTEQGNVVADHHSGEVLKEIAHGHVEIRITNG